MPVFPGEVTHNNPNAKILDLTRNQVKGIGIFGTIAERDLLDDRMRTPGFIAVVQQQGYLFTGTDWENENDWTEFPSSGGRIEGGEKYSVLTKSSDTDFDYDWTHVPNFEGLVVRNYSDSSASNEIKFFTSSGRFENSEETSNGTVLGTVKFTGVAKDSLEADGGMVRFTQVGAALDSGSVMTSMSVHVGTDVGEQLAFTINQERAMKLEPLDREPTAVSGGLYVSSSEKLYFGTAQ